VKSPLESTYLDSRALTLMRLHREREAKEAYNESLKSNPLYGSSLYGRGVVEQRLGDKVAAEADMRRAKELDAQTAEEFASYGFALRK
jgi:tetratricopeptide (TPR) repeat protein